MSSERASRSQRLKNLKTPTDTGNESGRHSSSKSAGENAPPEPVVSLIFIILARSTQDIIALICQILLLVSTIFSLQENENETCRRRLIRVYDRSRPLHLVASGTQSRYSTGERRVERCVAEKATRPIYTRCLRRPARWGASSQMCRGS